DPRRDRVLAALVRAARRSGAPDHRAAAPALESPSPRLRGEGPGVRGQHPRYPRLAYAFPTSQPIPRARTPLTSREHIRRAATLAWPASPENIQVPPAASNSELRS